MKKLVSILIPVYNADKWIDETIKSAINQVWPYKEIIIVDDGSTDNTYNYAKKYESKNVKIIKQDNSGACVARNTAFNLAQGDYIQWLDADDLLAPDKILQQLKYNNENIDPNILLSSSFGTFYYSIKRAIFTPHRLWQDLSPADYVIFKFNENIWMNPAVFLVSRKISEKAGPWNENLIRDNDGEYFLRVVSSSKYVKFEPKAICFYRIGNSNSLSSNRSKRALGSIFLSTKLCINNALLLENSERIRAACIMNLQNHLPYFYPENTEILQEMYFLADKLGGKIYPPKYSWKFNMAKKIFGWEIAFNMKIVAWSVETIIRKYIDCVFYKYIYKENNTVMENLSTDVVKESQRRKNYNNQSSLRRSR